MDDETRTAIASLAESVATGFARMDHYFELQQAQHVEFRAEVNTRLDVLTERVDRLDRLKERVDDLRR
jgi:hypothetical protein